MPDAPPRPPGTASPRRFAFRLTEQQKARQSSFIDQGFQGLANLGVNALLARSLSKGEFASVGLILGIYFFVLGLHRSNVTVPFILDTSRPGPERARDADAWWWFNLVFLALVAIVLWIVCAVARLLLTPDDLWVQNALAYAPVLVPALCLTEFGRRWLHYAGKPLVAAAAACLYFTVNVLIASIVLITGAGLGLGMSAWVLAAAAYMTAVIVAAPPLAASPRAVAAVWRPHARFAGWQMLTHLPYALYNNSVVLLIGVFGGPIAAATFAASRTLSSPILSAGAAIDIMDSPRAARALATHGVEGLKQSIARTRRLLVAINGAYLLLVLAATRPMLQLAFGDRYLDHEMEVRILTLAFFMFGLNQSSEMLLIILRQSRVMLLTRCLAAGAAVVALALLAGPFGAVGCAAAVVGVQVINTIALRLAERHATAAAAPS